LIRLILQPVALMFISLLILSLIARALGSTQPPNPALQGFMEGCEGKPQPCWYGIVPGVTTVAQAKNILSNYFNGDPNRLESSLCDFEIADFELDVISLTCRGVHLGDVMSVIGVPDEVRTTGWGLNIVWGKASTLATIAERKENWISLYSKVNGIFSAALYSKPPDAKILWFGFVTNWRYCRLLNLPTDECTKPPTIN
jgi:hypothetical protein